MGIGDLNPHSMGAAGQTSALKFLTVCYCKTWPVGPCISCTTQPIKVKGRKLKIHSFLIDSL
jgi:hypothetical protein